MEFRINHITNFLRRGIIISACVFAAALLIFLIMGITAESAAPVLILGGIFILCAAAEVIFVLLYLLERIFGTKVIINDDHVRIKMLLRRKTLRFDEIADTKYTHYECTRDNTERKQRSDSLLYKYAAADKKVRMRSRLIFYLDSGRAFSLNDDATNYKRKQKQWMTNPGIDPDEDVSLYQAYQCYLHACRQFYNSH